ncbi:hypothetical protein EUX98_g7292 [Antrodiella citrinella]|uniref:Cytochrome P450 n=1 Tax=Antrodiella citrinella TaxID=2447956 RepID=A0A4S4MM71_9APHY|nr:hypothetical protein EUX98_g7292 [Antrodiella citrinella]
MSLTILDILLGAVGVLLLHLIVSRNKTKLPLPPGPKGLPILGNVIDMPTSHEWLKFIDWSKKWGTLLTVSTLLCYADNALSGDIVSVTLLGQTIVILGSATHAVELLEKRSSNYSDRPKLIMGGEIVGWDQTLALTPYSERFREYRRFFHRFIGNRTNTMRFHPLVEKEMHNFLRRLQRAPDELAKHIRHTAGTIILTMSHGYKVHEESDSYLELVTVAIDQFTASTSPGAFLVDVLPALRYVPKWFPGAGFQKTADIWRKNLTDMTEIPFKFVQEQMRAGTVIPNFTSGLLESEKLDAQKVHNIKWSAASLYSGGADTTVSAIYGFFLAMTLFPEAQREAQAEIDAVIGQGRLPTLEDRDKLPYVEALIKEVLRFNPVAPLVMIRKFLHDPAVYEDPMIFKPSRYLASEGKQPEQDPKVWCFGFGRRVCPGQYLADVSVWLSCAMTLAAFDISHVVENGKVVEVENAYLSGTISHPKPFRCALKPRSSKAEALILAADEYRDS